MRTVTRVGDANLVLQSHLHEALTTADMRVFGLGLVTATPSGPAQDLGRHGWRLPHQRKEEPPDLGDRERQEFERQKARVRAVCCFLLTRPPCRRCWVCCARWAWSRTTVR